MSLFDKSGIKPYNMQAADGAWPSGKAPVFGTGIRGFESLRPSQTLTILVFMIL